MAEAQAEIRVLPKDAPLPAAPPFHDASVRERWNDYGIGLLLQGDLKGAEAAFLAVTRMQSQEFRVEDGHSALDSRLSTT